MDKQLFLLNSSLNNAILRTRDECVLVWELQLLGIQSGKVYSLQELQSSYKTAAKVLETHLLALSVACNALPTALMFSV